MKNSSECLPEIFGSYVFNEETMKEKLSEASFNAWKKCTTDGTPLNLDTANEIAQAMKLWAIQYGQYVKVLSPLSLVEQVKQGLVSALKQYD